MKNEFKLFGVFSDGGTYSACRNLTVDELLIEVEICLSKKSFEHITLLNIVKGNR